MYHDQPVVGTLGAVKTGCCSLSICAILRRTSSLKLSSSKSRKSLLKSKANSRVAILCSICFPSKGNDLKRFSNQTSFPELLSPFNVY